MKLHKTLNSRKMKVRSLLVTRVNFKRSKRQDFNSVGWWQLCYRLCHTGSMCKNIRYLPPCGDATSPKIKLREIHKTYLSRAFTNYKKYVALVSTYHNWCLFQIRNSYKMNKIKDSRKNWGRNNLTNIPI